MGWMEYRLFFSPGTDTETVLYLLHENGFEGSYEDAQIEVSTTEDGYEYKQKTDSDVEIVTFSQKVIKEEEWKELFGTGTHATTQDCLRLMSHLDLQQKTVLDLGTGSGILAIFAKLAGASHVLAVDLNPSSEMVYRRNAALNGIEEVQILIGDAVELSFDVYDLIVINIGAEESIKLLPKVVKSLKHGGQVLVSGIVEWAEERLRKAYDAKALKLQKRLQSDEWVTLLYKR